MGYNLHRIQIHYLLRIAAKQNIMVTMFDTEVPNTVKTPLRVLSVLTLLLAVIGMDLREISMT